ncbi:MAG: hypothetical protein E7158_03530 [Firmicutes bacterium]|nr:hypothetical protein [Bacillota bacterium]
MKQIQKRYIYSSILASIFFIVIYVILQVHILISILLTIIIYIGGIFLFQKDDIREFNTKSINDYYYMASKVQNQADISKNSVIIENVKQITDLTDSIIVSLSQRPKKVEQVFDFFDYYLDITYKILYKYNYLNMKEEKTKEDNKFIKDINKNIEKIKDEFNKQYKNMQEAKVLDMETEIKMFESTSGVTKENVEVGGKDE